MMEKSESHPSMSSSEVTAIFNLLVWEQPPISAVSLIALNCLFWLIVLWNKSLIFIFSLFGVIVFAYNFVVFHILPELIDAGSDENPQNVLPASPAIFQDLSHYLRNFMMHLRSIFAELLELRQRNHALFCLMGCSFFSFLAIIGHFVPGVLIIYFLGLIITLGPGIVLHLIPPTIYDQMVGFFTAEIEPENKAKAILNVKSASDSDTELEEFLPEPSDDVLRQLSLKDESSGLPDIAENQEPESLEDSHMLTIRELGMDSFVSESDESSLYKGLGGFPSVEEEDESDLEEELSEKLEVVKETDADDKNGIHFSTEHFKEESSESDSDVFTEGLTFTPVEEEKDIFTKKSDLKTGNKKDETVSSTEVRESTPKVSTSSDLDLMDFEILEAEEESDFNS